MRLSVTLSSQYPLQFGEDTRKAMQNNCDNLIAFSVNDVDDAQLLMKRFRDYTAEDLISTDQYQAWTKLPLEGGRYLSQCSSERSRRIHHCGRPIRSTTSSRRV